MPVLSAPPALIMGRAVLTPPAKALVRTVRYRRRGLYSMDIDSQPPEGTTQGSDAAAAALEEDRRQAEGNGQGPDRRKSEADRRTGLDRRQRTAAQSGYPGPERRSG